MIILKITSQLREHQKKILKTKHENSFKHKKGEKGNYEVPPLKQKGGSKFPITPLIQTS